MSDSSKPKPKGKPEKEEKPSMYVPCTHCGKCPVKKADPADKLSREKELRDRQRTDF